MTVCGDVDDAHRLWLSMGGGISDSSFATRNQGEKIDYIIQYDGIIYKFTNTYMPGRAVLMDWLHGYRGKSKFRKKTMKIWRKGVDNLSKLVYRRSDKRYFPTLLTVSFFNR